MLIIETKEQLKKATKENQDSFIVVRDLAQKLYKTRKISKLSKKAAIAITLAFGIGTVGAPFTAGSSLGAAGAIAATTTTAIGGSTVMLTAIFIGGVLFLFALHKGYDVDLKIVSSGTVRVNCSKK